MTYYNHYGIECFDLLNLFLKPAKQEEAFYLGNVIKYIYRAGIKDKENEIADIKKALDYFDRFFKLSLISNYDEYFHVSISYPCFMTIMDALENMPLYKKVFFSQLLYCAITGRWEGLKEIYKSLKSITQKELEDK